MMPITIEFVDPPSGWLYGFPKPIDDEYHKDRIQWYLDNGYPQKLIEQGMLNYVRHFMGDKPDGVS